MRNLKEDNILCDDGELDENTFENAYKYIGVKLPNEYIKFIKKHNTSSLFPCRYFDFYDDKRRLRYDTDSLDFCNFLKIRENMDICLEQSTDDPNNQDRFKFYKYFSELLIPFGENGGGDYICFDYRKDPNSDNPPVVFWYHDVAEQEDRTSFIANNFEEFINMLHECEDDI